MYSLVFYLLKVIVLNTITAAIVYLSPLQILVFELFLEHNGSRFSRDPRL